jgi:type IV secretory pathway VirB10-like protein
MLQSIESLLAQRERQTADHSEVAESQLRGDRTKLAHRYKRYDLSFRNNVGPRTLVRARRTTMASTERIFFAGVATSVLLIGVGFGGGVMLGKTALEDVPQTKRAQTKSADTSPPARVVLPALTEAAPSPPARAPVQPIQAAVPVAPKTQANPQPEPELIPAQALESQKHDIEKDKEHQAKAEKQQAERAERHRKAAERDRHRRVAERKARQEMARAQQKQQQDVHPPAEQLGVLALEEGDEPSRQSDFFGD